MRRHLHHLNSLRFFEVAARRLSFTEAAAELCVTQAAVSHQVRSLEQALGQPLFERSQRQVRLLPAGERLLAELSGSFGRIDALLDQLKHGQTPTSSLRLAVTPTFSSRWLIPRLPRFRSRHPDIELHLHHDTSSNLRAKGQLEAAVLWSRGRPGGPRMLAQPLFGTALSPVCAPGLIRADQPLDSPAAVRHYPLLHEDSFADWERWVEHAGIPDLPVRRGQLIDDSNALLQAAAAGHGLALGHLALIGEDLRSGQLLQPFALSIPARGAYWLVCSPQMADQPSWHALCDFLREELGDTGDAAEATAP